MDCLQHQLLWAPGILLLYQSHPKRRPASLLVSVNTWVFLGKCMMGKAKQALSEIRKTFLMHKYKLVFETFYQA
jgi:hypothetical protein